MAKDCTLFVEEKDGGWCVEGDEPVKCPNWKSRYARKHCAKALVADGRPGPDVAPPASLATEEG